MSVIRVLIGVPIVLVGLFFVWLGTATGGPATRESLRETIEWEVEQQRRQRKDHEKFVRDTQDAYTKMTGRIPGGE